MSQEYSPRPSKKVTVGIEEAAGGLSASPPRPQLPPPRFSPGTATIADALRPEASTSAQSKEVPVEPVPVKRKPKATADASTSRKSAGTTALPVARVLKIVKAEDSSDRYIFAKEAVFLISLATEYFIQKLTEAAYINARLDKRKFVQYRDLAKYVQGSESLWFLRESGIIRSTLPLDEALQKRKKKTALELGQVDDDDENDVIEAAASGPSRSNGRELANGRDALTDEGSDVDMEGHASDEGYVMDED